MRPIYRVVVVLLLILLALPIFPTSIRRLYQTSRYFLQFIPLATHSPTSTAVSSDKPTGLIASSGIELLTFGTPNGQKVKIALEELKAAYGKPYTQQNIPIMQNVQKEPWYTKLSPNGKIPVIVDHDKGGLAVMEGIAILQYLTRNYDPDHKLSFASDPEQAQCEQWMAWQHGGLGPMQGQMNHFYRMAKEVIPYAIQRFVGEVERLYGVLDKQLEGRDWIVGDKYSIADIANFSWINYSSFGGIDIMRWPNLAAWHKRCLARPAVSAVATSSQMANPQYEQKLKEDQEARNKEEKLQQIVRDAKAKYGYEYSSP
ncbi:glutathione S-transferase [Cryomyces antarcticus]